MHVHVAAWCRDTYEHGLPCGTDPKIGERGDSKVYRGSNTDGNLNVCRSKSCDSHSEVRLPGSIGSRVVFAHPDAAAKRSTEPVNLFGD